MALLYSAATAAWDDGEQLVPDTARHLPGAATRQVLLWSGFSHDDLGFSGSPPDRFEIQTDGIYLIEFSGMWSYGRAGAQDSAGPVMGYQGFSVNKNDEIVNQFTSGTGMDRADYPNGFWVPAHNFCSTIQCEEGDYLQVVAYQQSSMARWLMAATNSTDSSTTMTLNSTYGMRTGDICWMNGEALLVTAVPSDTTITVQRGFLGTTKVASSVASVFNVSLPSAGAPCGFTQGAFGAITSTTATNIAVTPSSCYFTDEYVRCDDEIMKVTSVPDSSHINVARGQRGTTAATHANLALITSGRWFKFTSLDSAGNPGATITQLV